MAARKPRVRSEPVAEPTPVPNSFALAETLDLMAAAPLTAALLQRRGSDLVLDASAVRRLGGQCLQVLLAAHETWQADGHILRIVMPSHDFIDTTVLLGAGSAEWLQAAA